MTRFEFIGYIRFMIRRTVNPLKDNSFFLFGARGTGKTTLLKQLLEENNLLSIKKFDLLDSKQELRLQRDPSKLESEIGNDKYDWVIIDEVQKAPKLLDHVHKLIVEKKIKFALTGSSARKLKRGGANLLAGRAFMFYLFPLTYKELGEAFNLEEILLWGSLPRTLEFQDSEQRELFLESYVQTYLKEEVVAEQLVRNLTPFRIFLEIVAQCNGEIINYSKLAREANTDDNTIRNYFDILEETHIGFRLLAYDRSLRKQQVKSPKFYLFDLGVKRALNNFEIKRLVTGSSNYGKAFEHFIVTECFRLNHYAKTRYKLSYFRSKDNREVDLIIQKSKEKFIFIEIKSTDVINKIDLTSVKAISKEVKNSEAWVLCREAQELLVDGVRVMPWRKGLDELFGDC